MTMCDLAAPNAEAEVPEKEAADACVDIPWADIVGRMKTDARMELFLQLFQEKYDVSTSIEAFTKIPSFLGDYMVREFDYRLFCVVLGDIEPEASDDAELWTAHMSQNLSKDLIAASSLMLRLAMTIAKVHGLDASDWKDINTACSNAVRTLPACYTLQRALPGAMSAARAWKHLPDDLGEYVKEGENPWLSEENQQAFESTFNFPWARVEAIVESDQNLAGVFSGRFKVVEVVESEGISLVSLEAVYIGAAPKGLPMKATAVGDIVLFEVEAAVGNLIAPGFHIEADFCELESNTCFMMDLRLVSPAWAP